MALVKLSRKGELSVSYDSLSLSEDEGNVLLSYAEHFVTVFKDNKPALEFDQSVELNSLLDLGETESFKDDIVKALLSKKDKVRNFSIVVGGASKKLKTTIADDSLIRDRLRSIFGTNDFSVEENNLSSLRVIKRVSKVVDFSALEVNSSVMQGA